MINSKANNYKRQLGEYSLKNPLLECHFNKFEFRSKPSLITVICMDPHSSNNLFATKYCFVILGDDSSFFFLIISLFFVFFFVILCHFVIINFYKNYVIIIILFNYYFFMKITLIFSCSGLFRHVPCSWFYRRPILRTMEVRVGFKLHRQKNFRNHLYGHPVLTFVVRAVASVGLNEH